MPPRTRSESKSKPRSNLEEVTNDLAKLKIQSQTTKQTTPNERLRNAMVVVNEASQSLSAAAKSGWKLGSAIETEWSEAKVGKITEPVGDALGTLRSIYREQGNLGKVVDVERAALGVVSKLNSLQMYKSALALLGGIRPSILTLLGVSDAPESRPKSRSAKTVQRPSSRTGAAREAPNADLSLLSLPLLPDLPSITDPATIQSLSVAFATFQAHSIKSVLAILDNTHLHDLYKTLISPDFTITRAPPQPGALPQDQLGALFVGAFQSIAGSPVLLARPSEPSSSTSTTARKPLASRAPSATRATSSTRAAKPIIKQPPIAIQGPDEITLLVRKQALLILARSPSLEKDINLFWDQATKWGSVYVKSVSASATPPSEQQIAQTLSGFFSDLIAAAPSGQLSGSRFEIMCDWWLRFAKKVKDVETIRKITGLLNPPSTPKRSTQDLPIEPLVAAPTKSSSTKQSRSALLAMLDRAALSPSLENMFAAAEALLKLDNTGDLGRLVGAISGLRKACVACWEDGSEEEQGRKGAVRAVVDGMVKCAEKPGFPNEVTVSTIDALLTLARSELDLQDYESHGHASSRIEKALGLVEKTGSAERSQLPAEIQISSQLSDKTRATLLRAVSNTAYTLAGALYNANQAAKAIVFADHACLIGERALGLTEPSSDKELDALESHLPRRWELLAVCRLKAADRQGAANAFGRALVGTAEHLDPDAQTLDTKSAQLIDQFVRVSVGELFDPNSVVLARLFRNSRVGEGIMSIMMEKVMGILDEMAHKPIARRAMDVAVQELMRIWDGRFPVKRARLMIDLLKQEYRSSAPSDLKVSSEEILGLLSSEDLKDDTSLKQYIPQYTIQTHIWTALLLHKSNAHTSEIAQHATIASNELLKLLDPPPLKRVTSKSAGKKPARSTSKRGGKAGVATAAGPPVKKMVVVFQDRIGLVRSIDMLAQVLGLLGHTFLKLQFMHSITWLCEESDEVEIAEAHIRTSIDLSSVYLELGQVAHATSVIATANDVAESNASQIEVSTLVLLRLLYADLLARDQQTEESVKTYHAALELSEHIENIDKHAPYMVRTQARLQALQRSAIACGVYASIQALRDDTVSALSGLTQALRLWNRAVDILIRMSEKAQPTPSAEPANPFEVQDTKANALDDVSQAKKTVSRGAILDGIQWQIAQGLLRTIFDIGEAYSLRGSVREAEFFLAQAGTLSESLQAPVGVGRSLIRQAELKMARGLLDDGLEMLATAEDIVADPVGIDTATLHCFLGHHRQREASGGDAYAMYSQAEKILNDLDTAIGELRQRRPELNSTQEMLVPEIRGLVLKEQIWLGQIGEVQPEEQVSVNALDNLPSTLKLKSEQASLLGRIALFEVFSQFRSDLFLSSLTESTIAVPMGMTSKESTPLQVTSTASNALSTAEQNFWKTLQLSVSRGDSIRTREAATNLARIMAFQSSLGKQGAEGAVLTATLLDYSNATTLRREMLDAVSNKDKTAPNGDDLIWPTLQIDGQSSKQPAQKSRGLFPSADPEDDLEAGGQEMRQYWQFLKEKYSKPSFDSSIAQNINTLPKHWTVVTINVTEDNTSLIISRQRARHPPVIFCLPLDRRGRDDEDEKFDFDDAMDELTSIIETSDRITHEGVNIEGNKGAIAEWWSERTTLDERMRELLENIEFCWLGVFKTILSTPLNHGSDTLSLLRGRLDKAFKRNGIGGDKTSTRPKLDKGLLDCFAAISPKCRDEELEDLAYFILDLYQLHGTSVALSEVDMDTLVVDLRNVLEEHASKTKPPSTPVENHHMFLVLDKNVQRLPWESLPILRGQSVSRIPSISFLVDRIQLARYRQGLPMVPSETESDAVDRARVDPGCVRYVLNPKGDLKHTEKQFGPWLKKMTKEAGWTGIIGRKPSEEEMAQSLAGADLFIYFGHGGGEQFIRSQKIKHLQQCAATMLWGCSSGAMRDMGDFDPIGTPYHYMLAGCPTLVATLWDVTDRECDRFAQSVFTSLGIDAPRAKAGTKREEKSVVQAVASAREACKLKYLTGAAPVVYGIPFYL